MKRGRSKKAQLYVIAAVIIIMSVVAMAGVSNYIVAREEPKDFYDLSESLGLEGAWVVDYGIYVPENEVDDVVSSFVSQYADYVARTGEEFELAIIYGNNERGVLEVYNRESFGTVCIETGTGEVCSPNYKASRSEPIYFTEGTNFEIAGTLYEVNLQENQNFLFVLTTSEGFERYIYENMGQT